jgi:hypothetical protein
VGDLLRAFPNLPAADEIRQAAEIFPLAITPYYASLIRELSPADPVFRMAVPSLEELHNPGFLRDDPLEEDHDMPVPGLVHRYSDRALFWSPWPAPCTAAIAPQAGSGQPREHLSVAQLARESPICTSTRRSTT